MTAIRAPEAPPLRAPRRVPALEAADAPGARARGHNAPVIILGGGPIGLVCALLLARQGFQSRLVDARPLEVLQRDRRLLALSRGSLQVLDSLLGPDFAPTALIECVHVSSSGEPGATHLSAQDFGGVALGATIWYADLVGALAHAAAGNACIVIERPRRALRVDQSIDRVRVALDDGQLLEGCLAIDAEGSPPPRPREPAQFALLADVGFAQGAPECAMERFTREGPLALLPVPSASAALRADAREEGTTRMSMIWCLPASLARARMDMAAGELLACIGRALGPRVGAPVQLGDRSIFPLTVHWLRRTCEHRLVHLGNAAQTLHPVAGQGFNLGIRDCVALVESLIDAHTDDSIDALAALTKYRARRRLDRAIVPSLTSALPRIFTSLAPPVALARSAAMVALDLVPIVRREFARLLMFGAPR